VRFVAAVEMRLQLVYLEGAMRAKILQLIWRRRQGEAFSGTSTILQPISRSPEKCF
jgi:hypothetical protein